MKQLASIRLSDLHRYYVPAVKADKLLELVGQVFASREQVRSIWLASPIQVYLDLLGSEGRAKEMAEHLRKERIGF